MSSTRPRCCYKSRRALIWSGRPRFLSSLHALTKKPVRLSGSQLRHTLLLVSEAMGKADYGLRLDVLTNRTPYESVTDCELTDNADFLRKRSALKPSQLGNQSLCISKPPRTNTTLLISSKGTSSCSEAYHLQPLSLSLQVFTLVSMLKVPTRCLAGDRHSSGMPSGMRNLDLYAKWGAYTNDSCQQAMMHS
jgi:hypothetical protein